MVNLTINDLRNYVCAELDATLPILPLKGSIACSSHLTPKPLDVQSANCKLLKVWDQIFTTTDSGDLSNSYLSNFDQYALNKDLRELAINFRPEMKEEVDRLLSPQKVKYIPFTEVETLLHNLLPEKPHYLLSVKKVKQLIREIPVFASSNAERQKDKAGLLGALDTMPTVNFFEPYLLLNPEEMSQLRTAVSQLCHKELGKEYKQDVIVRLEKLQTSSLLKDQKSKLGPFYCKVQAEKNIITKQGVEALRHLGIYRLLSVLNLHHHVIPGVYEKSPESYLVMPQVELQSLKTCRISDYDKKTEEAMATIGVLHALLHIQDGGSMNVKLNSEKGAVCYDLAKSLIPHHVYISYSYPDCSRLTYFLTLNSIYLQKEYRTLPLPSPLIEKLRSETFLKAIESMKLKDYLVGDDPLKKKPELVAQAERALKERGRKLNDLAKRKSELTVEDVFEALFSEEMIMIKAAEVAGIKSLRGIDLMKIYTTVERTAEVETAYKKLIQSKVDVVDYAKLNR